MNSKEDFLKEKEGLFISQSIKTHPTHKTKEKREQNFDKKKKSIEFKFSVNKPDFSNLLKASKKKSIVL